MIRMFLCVVIIFLIGLHTRDAYAQLDGTCTGAASACSGEDNAALCNSASPPACICNINYEVTGSNCALTTCTLGTSAPATVCGTNTACSSNNQCTCAVNHEVVVATSPDECTAIACTADNAATKCTDANAHCDTGTSDKCICNINFEGTNLAACAHKSADCTADITCTETNSACHVGTGCDCDNLYTVDATGACATKKTCSLSGILSTTCGTNTVCEASGNEYKCECIAKYTPSATGCVEASCSVAGDCGNDYQCTSASKCACATDFVPSGSSCQTDCSSNADACHANAACVGGACICNVNYEGNGGTCTQISGCSSSDVSLCHSNSKCNSENKCECADTFTTSGTMCKKDCSSDSSVCDANAACTSNVCQCNVNYEGNGATCTQKTCTGTDAASCHANSKCVNDKCQCANNSEPNGQTCEACPTGWESDGTVCKKTCTSDTSCGPTTAVCTSSKCECATNYVGNGTSCTAKTCSANSECGSASNYTCTSGRCACADGFSFSNTERDCISAGGIVLYSLSLMIAALLLSIFTNKM